jgi:hypothetical protein
MRSSCWPITGPSALSIANAAELHVDLDYQPVETVGRRNKRRMLFRINIERRVAL